MRRLISIFVLVLLSGLASTPALAQFSKSGLGWVGLADPSAPTILFVNGIKNSGEQSATSSRDLRDTLVRYGLEPQKYNHQYFYSASEGIGPKFSDSDLSEVAVQTALSGEFWNADPYFKNLGQRYLDMQKYVNSLTGTVKRVSMVTSLLKGSIEEILTKSSGIVVVSHSQGNLYSEAAYAMLVAEGKNDLLKRVKFVGVASAAGYAPSGRWVTHNADDIIRLGIPALIDWYASSYRPLPNNFIACYSYLSILVGCGYSVPWPAIDPVGHGFSEVYLNDKLTSIDDNQSLPYVIFRHVIDSLGEIRANLLIERFDDYILDKKYWTKTAGSVTLLNGIATLSCGAAANTKGKLEISGDKGIVIEARFAGTGINRSSGIYLFDTTRDTTDAVGFGDTNYSASNATAGMFFNGSGAFATPRQYGSGTSVSTYKEYRLTITGNSAKIERGTTLAAIEDSYTATLPSSIVGKKFYLHFGSGTAPYCPGTQFDWIRVSNP